jgi:hypothetical protein
VETVMQGYGGENLRRRLSNRAKTLVASGVVLLLLGVGNATFGVLKAREYAALLSSATVAPSAIPPQVAEIPFKFDLDTDKRSVYVSKLDARIQFYRFVALGGQCFIALGVALLLGTLLLARRFDGDLSDTGEPPTADHVG